MALGFAGMSYGGSSNRCYCPNSHEPESIVDLCILIAVVIIVTVGAIIFFFFLISGVCNHYYPGLCPNRCCMKSSILSNIVVPQNAVYPRNNFVEPGNASSQRSLEESRLELTSGLDSTRRSSELFTISSLGSTRSMESSRKDLIVKYCKISKRIMITRISFRFVIHQEWDLNSKKMKEMMCDVCSLNPEEEETPPPTYSSLAVK